MIAEKTTRMSLERMLGKHIDLVTDGESEEHAYLLSARPLQWAVEIDGEVWVNDAGELPVAYGRPYRAEITELAGMQLLAKLLNEA